MRKRYPERVFTSPTDAENYKTTTAQKGIKYHIIDDKQGNYYVGEKKRHPYWASIGKAKERIRYYDEEGQEI